MDTQTLVLTTTQELGIEEFPEANANVEASEARFLELVTERAVSAWGTDYRVEVAYGTNQTCSEYDLRARWDDIVQDVFNNLEWVVTNA